MCRPAGLEDTSRGQAPLQQAPTLGASAFREALNAGAEAAARITLPGALQLSAQQLSPAQGWVIQAGCCMCGSQCKGSSLEHGSMDPFHAAQASRPCFPFEVVVQVRGGQGMHGQTCTAICPVQSFAIKHMHCMHMHLQMLTALKPADGGPSQPGRHSAAPRDACKIHHAQMNAVHAQPGTQQMQASPCACR